MTYSDILRSVNDLLQSHGKPAREVYLDHENSGMIMPEALKAMIDTYREVLGHPSITHRAGWSAYQKLFEASSKISSTINAEINEIVYTHSGTEANNLAILGSAQNSNGRKKILVSSIEHLSIIFPAEQLEKHGFKVVKIPVDQEGFINTDFLSDQLDSETLLVSIAAVNHEIGTIQDLKAISEIIKDKDEKILIHTDACDALGKIPLNMKKLNVDLASFSSHKIYGPKGTGALFIKEGIKMKPVIHGQLSTQRLWPGVENIPSITGFSKAVETIHKNFEKYRSKMIQLRDHLINGIIENVEEVLLNGPKGEKRSPDNANLSFLRCEGEAITVELSMKGIYVSSGSACTSRVLQPSHVLLAIGRKYEEAHGSILMKVSPFHSKQEIDYVLQVLPEAIKRIRSIAPSKF